MAGNDRRTPPRWKIVWGFGRMAAWAAYYIKTSPFISTEEKEKLLRQLQEFLRALMDTNARARGLMPPLPSAVHDADKKRIATLDQLKKV